MRLEAFPKTFPYALAQKDIKWVLRLVLGKHTLIKKAKLRPCADRHILF